MEISEAKAKNAVEIETQQQEFDMQLKNLINRLNKRDSLMRSIDYMEMASDIELFSMVFTGISEELRLKESVRELLTTLD